MLYPIELLRHSGRRSEWRQRDGVHVNGKPLFCHVVIVFLGCSPERPPPAPQGHHANCNAAE